MGIGTDAGVIGTISQGVQTVAIAAVSKLFAAKVWRLTNLHTRTTIVGQFPANRVQLGNVGSNWAEIQGLNRQTAYLQFLNGKTRTLSIEGEFFAHDITGKKPVSRIEELIKWTEVDPLLRRPPLLSFSLGDGLGLQKDVLLTGLDDIEYSIPNGLGGIRRVSFTMNFKLADRSLLAAADQGRADEEVVDTRYAFAGEDDYYELLALEEYGDPMLGVIVRQRHPSQPLLKVGQRVALSALEGVRSEIPTQTSIPLKGAFGRKDTATRRRRVEAFRAKAVERNVINFSAPKAIVQSVTTSGLFDYTFDQTFE